MLIAFATQPDELAAVRRRGPRARRGRLDRARPERHAGPRSPARGRSSRDELSEVVEPGAGTDRLDAAMRVAIGSDHAGFSLKGDLCTPPRRAAHRVPRLRHVRDRAGRLSRFHRPVARAVARGEFERGIVLGGSGTGEAIVANKVRGIRCVQAPNPVVARLGARAQRRQRHLVRRADHGHRGGARLRARVPGRRVPGGRHVPRVEKIARIEAEEAALG